MLDISYDIMTTDEILAREVPEDVVMTVIKAIMTDKNIDEVIISQHVYR